MLRPPGVGWATVDHRCWRALDFYRRVLDIFFFQIPEGTTRPAICVVLYIQSILPPPRFFYFIFDGVD